jgi:hypothetical protein
MWLGRRARRTRNSDSGDELAVEIEAFLAGTMLDHLHRRGNVVPGWARLNEVAHGRLPQILQTKRTRDSTPVFHAGWGDIACGLPDAFDAPWCSGLWEEDAWRRAQRVLVDEILHLVGDDAERLQRVQQSTLVPLELRLIEIEARQGLTAFELVRCTRAALRSSAA